MCVWSWEEQWSCPGGPTCSSHRGRSGPARLVVGGGRTRDEVSRTRDAAWFSWDVVTTRPAGPSAKCFFVRSYPNWPAASLLVKWIMSVRVTGVLVTTSPQQEKEPPSKPPVAIVTPHRSNSLDILNFEEKRQLIASSLSLTDFLNRGGTATSPSSPTSGSIYGTQFPTVFYTSL